MEILCIQRKGHTDADTLKNGLAPGCAQRGCPGSFKSNLEFLAFKSRTFEIREGRISVCGGVDETDFDKRLHAALTDQGIVDEVLAARIGALKKREGFRPAWNASDELIASLAMQDAPKAMGRITESRKAAQEQEPLTECIRGAKSAPAILLLEWK